MAEIFGNVCSALVGWFNQNVLLPFKGMDFIDVLDIFVLAFVFYFLYRFAKKRRAMRLVMGVVLFFLIVSVGDAIHLTALKFVFGDFRQIGVIAILIIFQPELRSALERIGGKTFGSLQNIKSADKKNGNTSYVIESVSIAAQRLAAEKTGALIVIERNNDLVDYKSIGTTLDAVVSPQVLCTIFHKGAALHDGAVIIRNGRIAAAGSVLGMSSIENIDSELGTRHRAAISTTESSDAVVVVVSEETGNISIAHEGELERNFNYSSLRDRLGELLYDNKKTKKKSAPKQVKTDNAKN